MTNGTQAARVIFHCRTSEQKMGALAKAGAPSEIPTDFTEPRPSPQHEYGIPEAMTTP
jgi:hypothetical protein